MAGARVEERHVADEEQVERVLAEEPEARDEGDEEDERRGDTAEGRARSLTRSLTPFLRGEAAPGAFDEVREGESHARAGYPRGRRAR